MPRSRNGWIIDTGTMVEPVVICRSDDKSALSQSGCPLIACMTAGTAMIRVIRSSSMLRKASPGSNRSWSTMDAPQ